MATDIRCAECGAKCKDTDNYCPSCQASIKRQDLTHFEPLEGIEMEKWKSFIVKSTEHYIDIFRKHENKKVFVRFNPWAFLWCLPWFCFRKMYLEAVVIIVLYSLISIGLTLLINVSSILALILTLIVPLLCLITISLYANAIYKAHVKREISKSEPNMKRGGTSWLAVIIGYVVSGVVYELVSTLINLLLQ